MAVRTDITVDFQVEPRLIEVAAPSVEVTIQDLYDTLREIEDEIQNLDDEFLISAGGKEQLGGGVLVGITATLNHAQLLFEARRTPIAQGLVTSGGSPEIGSPIVPGSPTGSSSQGFILNDSTATFITDGVVQQGDMIFNQSDLSSTEIISINSETEIFTRGLGGGTQNVFEAGDTYVIFDVVQCNISGGNLVAVEDNLGSPAVPGADLDPVFPTFGTQIVRTASSSATLQEQADVEFASFNGGVTIDIVNGTSGTTFPTGTTRQPVNNFTDGLTITSLRGFDHFHVIGNATLPAGLDFTNFEIDGQSPLRSIITVDPAAITDGTEFFTCEVTGTVGTNIRMIDCIIRTVTMSCGLIEESFLDGTFTMLSSSGDAYFNNCRDLTTIGSSVIFDLTSSSEPMIFRNYIGAAEFTNIVNSNDVVIDIIGRVVVGPTDTTGTITVRGIGKIEGTSGGTTINDDNLIFDAGGRGFGGM